MTIAYDAQWQRWALLAGALVIWLLVVWRWRRTRVRRDPSCGRPTCVPGANVGSVDRSPLDDVLDDDAFWWERV